MKKLEKADWFNDNFKPIKCGPLGNCSACVFRNIKPYCIKLTCSYLDLYNLHSFYWVSKLRINTIIPEDVREFFDTTEKEDIQEIVLKAMKQAIIKKQNINQNEF